MTSMLGVEGFEYSTNCFEPGDPIGIDQLLRHSKMCRGLFQVMADQTMSFVESDCNIVGSFHRDSLLPKLSHNEYVKEFSM